MRYAPLLKPVPMREGEIAGNLDTSLLKALALAFMLCDHLGKMLFPNVPEMRILGRVAFPLYAWCLVVGACGTRDPLRYFLRILLLGVVSQPLYMLALNHRWSSLNILFSLSVSLAGLTAMRLRWRGSQWWGPILCLLIPCLLTIDYGWRGVLFVFVLYLARGDRGALGAAFIAYALFWGASSSPVSQAFGVTFPWTRVPWLNGLLAPFFRLQGMAWLALPLILWPKKSRTPLPAWLGYAAYPAHLLLVYGLTALFR